MSPCLFKEACDAVANTPVCDCDTGAFPQQCVCLIALALVSKRLLAGLDKCTVDYVNHLNTVPLIRGADEQQVLYVLNRT